MGWGEGIVGFPQMDLVIRISSMRACFVVAIDVLVVVGFFEVENRLDK